MYRKPIKYVFIYLIFTMIAYVVTYVKTDSHNMFLTVLVCSIYFIFMALGYCSIRFQTSGDSTYCEEFEYSNKIRNIIFFAAIATIIVSFVNIFSFYSSIQMALDYIVNPGAAYEYIKFVRRNNIADSGMITISSSLVGITLNTLSFTKFIVLIFLPLYWKDLSKTVRIIGIASIVVYVIQAFLIGAMINIGIIVFSLLPILIFMGGTIKFNMKSLSGVSKLVFTILLILAVILMIYFMGTRYVSVNSDIGEILSAGVSGLSFYISHGYVGLSKCFDLSFEPTFGATTFHGLATTFLPQDIYNSLWESSYLMRNQVQTGWQALQVWSTIFPWIASDISFFLIPFFMLCMGRFMGRVWRNAIIGKNPYAFLMMSQLMIFAFMIPANNQLFHSYGNSAGTILIYIMYRFSISNKKYSLKLRGR